jgi:hypothetical protein
MTNLRPEDAEEWLNKNHPTWRNPCGSWSPQPSLYLRVSFGTCSLSWRWNAEGDKYVKNPYRSPFEEGSSSRQRPTRTSASVSPALSIAEQLALLAKLRKEGSLTEEEFQTLKNRLIDGGKK